MTEASQGSNDPNPSPESAQNAQRMVNQHWDAVYRLVYRLTRNTHDADEMAQETFLRAINRAYTFQPGTNMRSWLLRIATNLVLDAGRTKKVARSTPLDQQDIIDDSSSAPRDVQNAELAAQLAQAIAQLPEVSRVVFVLRTHEDFSFRQIAETTGLTEATARWHMMQARRALMEQLDGHI